MKKILNFIKDYTFGFILGVLLFGIVGVYAVTTLQASKVTVDTTNMPNVGSNKTVQDTIEYLYIKSFCPVDFECYEIHETPQVGDYVKMTPTLTSFTPDKTYTGRSNQTINPSELNLWRVIRINDDGTIDMVSEYTSSSLVYFQGLTGYKNFVGYLNVVASKYENENYTIGSRYMGYNGQTEYLTDTANTVESTSTTPPWSSSVVSTKDESLGGGDSLYTTDTNLVKNAIGTLLANQVGTTTASDYWLASRYYGVYNYNTSSVFWDFGGLLMTSIGSFGVYGDMYGSGSRSFAHGSYLRPILILKSGINYNPVLGTSDDPFVLN